MILRLSYYYRQHMGDAGWQNLGVEGPSRCVCPCPSTPPVKSIERAAHRSCGPPRGYRPAEDDTRRYAIVDLKTGKSAEWVGDGDASAACRLPDCGGGWCGEQLEERYRAEAAALSWANCYRMPAPQELEHTGYTGRSEARRSCSWAPGER